MFYDKDIKLMAKSEGYKDQYSIWHDGSLEVDKTINCDVQPITKEIAYKEFGVDEKVKYRIFCDPDDGINIGTIIQYKNKLYRIIGLLEWDYLDFIIGDYHE